MLFNLILFSYHFLNGVFISVGLAPGKRYREAAWDTLIGGGPRVDPVIRTLVDEGGYPFPRSLWNLSFGFCVSKIELRVSENRPFISLTSRRSALSQHLEREAVSMTHPCNNSQLLGLAITSLGLEAKLQQKVSLTCVCRHIDLLVRTS